MNTMDKAREGRSLFACLLWAVLLTGCGSKDPPPFPVWSVQQSSPAARPLPQNGFVHYVRAAKAAESVKPKYLVKTSFTPDPRRVVLKAISKALDDAAAGAKRPCQFLFAPSPPFEPPPYQRGWRLLGRGLVWRIEDNCEAGDYDKAVFYLIVATKFGFDLCGGGATDASLGLAIADDARKAIAPYFGRLQNAHLAKLADGLTYALKSKPPLETTIANEERNMMAAVQFVQDCYRLNNTKVLQDNLGVWIKPTVKYLDDMRKADREKRPAYFQGLADDAKAEVAYCRKQASLFVAFRQGPEKRDSGPWWRFSHAFFRTLRPLIKMNDTSLARTRLLIIQATLQQRLRRGEAAPPNLEGFSKAVSTDPFTGKPFIYRAEGSDYDVYSVGENLIDDGGETDDAFLLPDLRTEIQLR